MINASVQVQRTYYAPATVREGASQHVPIYLQPFQPVNLEVRHFSTFFLHILASPGYAPGTIAVNVTWMERGFNAGQISRSMYPSIFNRLRGIARYYRKLQLFPTPYI